MSGALPAADAVVVLGSGWGPAADAFGPAADELDLAALPGYPVPTVPGHAATARLVPAGRHRVLLVLGRSHGYEGTPGAVGAALRMAAAAGVRLAVLTNAAGSLRPEWEPGLAVLVRDHLDLSGGGSPGVVRARYQPGLRRLARQVEPGLPEGVYAQLRGPQFETPAEVRMLRRLGADLVGMSTASEALVAAWLGLPVLALSLVTNHAAGTVPGHVDHADVLAAGAAAAPRLGDLLARLLARWDGG